MLRHPNFDQLLRMVVPMVVQQRKLMVARKRVMNSMSEKLFSILGTQINAYSLLSHE